MFFQKRLYSPPDNVFYDSERENTLSGRLYGLFEKTEQNIHEKIKQFMKIEETRKIRKYRN